MVFKMLGSEKVSYDAGYANLNEFGSYPENRYSNIDNIIVRIQKPGTDVFNNNNSMFFVSFSTFSLVLS